MSKRQVFVAAIWGVRIVLAAIVVGVPAAALWDYISPWPEAIAVLELYPGGTRVCVGLAATSVSGGLNRTSGTTVRSQRSYIMLPSVLWLPNVFTVSHDDTQGILVSHSFSDFVTLTLIYVGGAVGSLYMWKRAHTQRVERPRSVGA